MGNTGFYYLSSSQQHRWNVDSPNHRLLYSPVLSPAVYLCRLPVLHGFYFHCATFTFDYLITHYKLYQYGNFKQNGVSITQTPGEEKYVKCCLGAFRGQIYFQYDYRHTDMELFSTVAKTLAECRRQRDEWIAKKKKQ